MRADKTCYTLCNYMKSLILSKKGRFLKVKINLKIETDFSQVFFKFGYFFAENQDCNYFYSSIMLF